MSELELPPIVKHHPAATIAIVGIVCVGLFYVLRSGGSSSAVAADPNASLNAQALAYQEQQNQLQAAANQQGTQIAGQIELAKIQESGVIQGDSIAAGVSLAAIGSSNQLGMANIQGQLDENNNATAVSLNGQNDQVSMAHDSNQTLLGMAGIMAGEQEGITAANDQTQTGIAYMNQQTAENNSDNYTKVSLAQIKAAQSSSTASSIMGGIGGIASIAGMFL